MNAHRQRPRHAGVRFGRNALNHSASGFPPLEALATLALALACLAFPAAARELHVSVEGNDSNPGTRRAPLRTIQRGAELAQPGDIVTVHGGVYRERICPPRGGASERRRIVFRAAPGERVEVKGSEVVKGWTRVQGEVWKVTLPNTFFGNFNPFTNVLHGDWFNPKGRIHHTGAVYVNGEWLIEAAQRDEVLGGRTADAPLWFAEVDAAQTTIWAQFPGANPNEQLVEINVRPAVFYPARPGCDYITVRGFTLRHAATQWAPPTAEQIGLIGTHWSKGWIIESNIISHSICVGVSLGKYGDEFDNTSANTAEGYVKTIERAHAFRIPWTREHIGHHVVRYNHISHCEQAGIVGSLGCAFSLVEGNEIHDIHVRRRFSGAEMAGIKFHGAVDTILRRNHIYRTERALWLDWMAQGTRVTGNLCYSNTVQDLFLEVNHGPCLLDHNLFLSPVSLTDMSQGSAFAHNLFAGKIIALRELNRVTPFHLPHSTSVVGLTNIPGGDNRFFNNLFLGPSDPAALTPFTDPRTGRAVGFGLWVYDTRPLPLRTGGNVYFDGARPYTNEVQPWILSEQNPQVTLERRDGTVTLRFAPGADLHRAPTRLVTTALLGKAHVTGLPYENPDGSPVRLDADYFGRRRSPKRPTPGPFELRDTAQIRLRVW